MRTISALTITVLWAAAAAAQTPLGSEFVPADRNLDAFEQFGANVACDAYAICALVWTSMSPNGVVNNSRQWGRTITPSGKLSEINLLRGDESITTVAPVAARDHDFAIFGSIFNRAANTIQLNFRLFDETLRPGSATTPLLFPEALTAAGPAAVIRSGFVELTGLFLQNSLALLFFDSEGGVLRSPVVVNEITDGLTGSGLPELAVDAEGRITVVYSHLDGNGQLQVYWRRFGASGDPLGPEVKVSDSLEGDQYEACVTAAPQGQFIVAWLSRPDPNADFGEIWGRRYGPDGEPLTQPFRVSHALPAQSDPQAATDLHGNYLVAWDSHENGTYDVHGRLFRPDGTSVTQDELVINQDRSFDQLLVAAAFAPNGTLIVSYETDDPAVTGNQASLPVVRRFAASPGQEICATWDSKLQCNLGRTGGAMQLQLQVPSRRSEVTLLGDVDGDGRDDVCFYRDGLFSCDTSHEGTPPPWRERFGFPGDVPLLADVNGDGKADPCVRRGNRLACDTAHDGSEGYRIRFGRGGETPLLGDLDGDGKADLCLVSGSSWNCRLSATGQGVNFTFGKAGDFPALGDVNLDGKADPCVLRKGTLLCNTRHDGGPPDFTLRLAVPAGARLLFGNLDGL